MIITEFNEIESAAGRTAHRRRVLYAALDFAVYTDADFDIVIAACILHECGNTEAAKILFRFSWDEARVTAVQKCIDAVSGQAPADTTEAAVVCDAHRFEDSGIIGEAAELIRGGSVESYLSEPFNEEVYRHYNIKQAGLAAKKRRNAAENLYHALRSEITEVSSKGEAMLKEMLEAVPMYNKLLLIPVNGGFKMDGYYVWCGSVIYAAGEYHMFASRWRKELKFPQGYMTGSEIVHAVSKTPEGPFIFKEITLGIRQRGYWDSQMAHNPQIIKIGGKYVLYYLGAALNDVKKRRVGYAVSNNISGKWERQPKCVDLGREDCNNPSPCLAFGGGVLLAFRWGNQRIGVAFADRYDAPYRVLNEDIMPGIAAEDPFLYRSGNHYEMIVEDGGGAFTGHERFGAVLESADGVDWKVKKHCLAYDHTLLYSDLSIVKAERRERPTLLMDADGAPTHLYTAVYTNGESFNICQPLENGGREDAGMRGTRSL